MGGKKEEDLPSNSFSLLLCFSSSFKKENEIVLERKEREREKGKKRRQREREKKSN